MIILTSFGAELGLRKKEGSRTEVGELFMLVRSYVVRHAKASAPPSTLPSNEHNNSGEEPRA